MGFGHRCAQEPYQHMSLAFSARLDTPVQRKATRLVTTRAARCVGSVDNAPGRVERALVLAPWHDRCCDFAPQAASDGFKLPSPVPDGQKECRWYPRSMIPSGLPRRVSVPATGSKMPSCGTRSWEVSCRSSDVSPPVR